MTRKNIYPLPSIRENALFDRYSTIAIEHYYLAKQKYEELLSADIVFPDLNMDVYNTAKYSLQGTTQGRYLTGGVPPVRFSM